MAQEDMAGIPSIDISSFVGNQSSLMQQNTSKELAAACRTNGCVGIVGHGVDLELLRRAFDMVQKLFDLPYETKMKAARPNVPNHHRGYLSLGREQVSRKTVQEAKNQVPKQGVAEITNPYEGYQIGDEDNIEEYNIWLPEDALPGFKDLMTTLFSRMRKAGEGILEALIMSLNLSQDEAISVRNLHPPRFSQFRLAHYPPVSVGDLDYSTTSRISSHTDFSSFTLLFQDKIGGLEFEDRESGAYMPAVPKEGLLYMNIGDMFSRISNGYYPSALHRVSIPQDIIKEQGETKTIPARYSIPFFVAPDVEGLIEPQPSLVAARGSAEFAPIIFKEYAAQIFGLIEDQVIETTGKTRENDVVDNEQALPN